MALIGNRSVLLKSPGRYFGGSTVSDNRSNFGTPGSTRGRYFDGFPQINATPSGYRPPYSWIIAIKNGEMASVNNLNGSTTISPLSMAAGINGQATLTGSGDITSAVAQLVISMVANLTGSTSLSSADLRGYLNAVANISGGGTLASTIGALAWANAALSGTGTISNATPYATGTLSANIRGYSDLTPEGIADKVWQYIIGSSEAQDLLSAAGAAGDPLLGVVEGTLTLRDVQRIVLSVLAGQVTGAGTGTETFKGQAGENRVVSVVDVDGNRSSVTLNAS